MLEQRYTKRSWFYDPVTNGKNVLLIDKMKRKHKSLDSCNAAQISSGHS